MTIWYVASVAEWVVVFHFSVAFAMQIGFESTLTVCRLYLCARLKTCGRSDLLADTHVFILYKLLQGRLQELDCLQTVLPYCFNTCFSLTYTGATPDCYEIVGRMQGSPESYFHQVVMSCVLAEAILLQETNQR